MCFLAEILNLFSCTVYFFFFFGRRLSFSLVLVFFLFVLVSENVVFFILKSGFAYCFISLVCKSLVAAIPRFLGFWCDRPMASTACCRAIGKAFLAMSGIYPRDNLGMPDCLHAWKRHTYFFPLHTLQVLYIRLNNQEDCLKRKEKNSGEEFTPELFVRPG